MQEYLVLPLYPVLFQVPYFRDNIGSFGPGGLCDDMRAASTGLLDLPEAGSLAGPGSSSSQPIGIPGAAAMVVRPEMRRPSLPPGRGSFGNLQRVGSAGIHRNLTTHPSHAMPAGILALLLEPLALAEVLCWHSTWEFASLFHVVLVRYILCWTM